MNENDTITVQKVTNGYILTLSPEDRSGVRSAKIAVAKDDNEVLSQIGLMLGRPPKLLPSGPFHED